MRLQIELVHIGANDFRVDDRARHRLIDATALLEEETLPMALRAHYHDKLRMIIHTKVFKALTYGWDFVVDHLNSVYANDLNLPSGFVLPKRHHEGRRHIRAIDRLFYRFL